MKILLTKIIYNQAKIKNGKDPKERRKAEYKKQEKFHSPAQVFPSFPLFILFSFIISFMLVCYLLCAYLFALLLT